MPRTTFAAAACALAALAIPGAVGAQGEEHNCAGAVTSSLAGPGFGQVVAFFAHQQAVDNFGFANCGDTPRQNP